MAHPSEPTLAAAEKIRNDLLAEIKVRKLVEGTEEHREIARRLKAVSSQIVRLEAEQEASKPQEAPQKAQEAPKAEARPEVKAKRLPGAGKVVQPVQDRPRGKKGKKGQVGE